MHHQNDQAEHQNFQNVREAAHPFVGTLLEKGWATTVGLPTEAREHLEQARAAELIQPPDPHLADDHPGEVASRQKKLTTACTNCKLANEELNYWYQFATQQRTVALPVHPTA